MATMNLRKLPEKIKIQFKSMCVENEITMEEAIIRLMKKAIEKRTDFKKLFPKYDFKRGQDDKN